MRSTVAAKTSASSFLDRYGDGLRLAMERVGRDRAPVAGFEPALALPETSDRLERWFGVAGLRLAELDTVGRSKLLLLDPTRNPATRTAETLTALVTVGRAVAHVERTGERVMILAGSSANRATALRDAVQRALVLGLAHPDQLQVVSVVPEAARPKLWSSVLAEDPRMAGRNPVCVLERGYLDQVQVLTTQAASVAAELWARDGVRLWHPADLTDARCAGALRAVAEQAELPPLPGVARTHAHAVSTGSGLLGHHLGTTTVPGTVQGSQYFLVQHLATPALVCGLYDAQVPDYRVDPATGLHTQHGDPRFPATTYDPFEGLDPTFAVRHPETTAEVTELVRQQGGAGVVVSLHECLERYPRVRALLERGGVELPADPRALREWSTVMVVTGVLIGLERGLLDAGEVVVHGAGSYEEADYTPLATRAQHRVTGADDLRALLRAAAAGAALPKAG